MIPQVDPDAIKAGFDFLKGALDTIKDLKDLLHSKGEGREELERKIDMAERQVALGEAQLAQALGYKLCRAHFPPVPMLKTRVHPKYAEEISRCPTCGIEDPSPEYFERKENFERSSDNYNARIAQDRDGWPFR